MTTWTSDNPMTVKHYKHSVTNKPLTEYINVNVTITPPRVPPPSAQWSGDSKDDPDHSK